MPRVTISPKVLSAHLPLTQRFTVTEEHIDIMGHMNVGYYSLVFARAARQMTSLIGVTPAYIERERKGAFMLRNFTQFIAESYLGDELVVYSRVVAYSEKRYQYMHFMVNTTQGDQLAATMEALTTHADLVERRSIAFPLEIIANIEHYITEQRVVDWSQAPLCGVLSP